MLKSEKEFENKVSIDKLQKIHTLYNLNEILVLHKNQPADHDMLGEVKFNFKMKHLARITY